MLPLLLWLLLRLRLLLSLLPQRPVIRLLFCSRSFGSIKYFVEYTPVTGRSPTGDLGTVKQRCGIATKGGIVHVVGLLASIGGVIFFIRIILVDSVACTGRGNSGWKPDWDVRVPAREEEREGAPIEIKVETT